MKAIAERFYYDEDSTYPLEKLNEGNYFVNLLSSIVADCSGEFSDVDLVLFSSPRVAGNLESSRDNRRRKVLFMISDETQSVPKHLISHYQLIFKAYIPKEEMAPAGGIYSLPLGHVNRFPLKTPVAWEERKNSVFFVGNLNVNRVQLYRAFSGAGILPAFLVKGLVLLKQSHRLLARWNTKDLPFAGAKIEFTSGFLSGLPIAEYAEQIYQSRVVLCPRGFKSPETFRHFEAAAAGAVVISEMLPDVPLYRNSPFIQVKDWNEGRARLQALLTGPEHALKDLGAKTRLWYEQVLSADATKNRVLKLMREKMSQR